MTSHAIAPLAVSTRFGRRSTSIIEVRGALDFNTAGLLRTAFAASLAGGRSRIVLDLGDLEFMDSSGVGVLVRGLKSCKNADGALVLSRLGAQPRDVLRKVGLLRHFLVADDSHAAEDLLDHLVDGEVRV